ncbi:hypothetical protein B9H04_17570 [Halorubrum ezzemoulense DSM 17463]|uniref:Glycosyl transferase family 1 domain-containing protein n=1 Tax=Halorubrum ezzemoulense DSM 17463 TaxID=1121945 RepID=A0A1X4G3S6_HALEZ|nr:glycosyltransferase family 4 protein [Halorubrum ezzemoulense]OSO88142.1 hypothetical protein B9H04_17570 [Halorubrum ezzemoulense DSM 17463]
MNDNSVLLITPWDREGGLATYSQYLTEEISDNTNLEVFNWDYESLFERGSSIGAVRDGIVGDIRESDVIHIQYTFGRFLLSGLIISAIAKLFNTETVLTQHERFENIPMAKFVYYYHQFLYVFVDRIIVHTTARKEMIPKLHRKNVLVIPHGVIHRDMNKSVEINEPIEILVPGMIRPIKGHVEIIRAMSHLSNFDLRIIGAIDNKQYYKRIVEEIEQVPTECSIAVETGFIPERELQAEIRGADIVVLAYQRYTSMSGILAHCISWNTPTLVTDCKSFRSVINTEHAFIPSHDPIGIAKGIRSIGESKQRRKIISKEFKRISQECSWSNVAEQTENCYQQVQV